MNWFKLAMFLITYGPKLLELARQLVEEMQQLSKPQKKLAKHDLKLSLQDAKETKSLAPIQQFRERISMRH